MNSAILPQSLKKTLMISVSSLILLSGCALKPHPLTTDEMTKKGAEDRSIMFQGNAPLTKPLTLSDAIARVLSYNLDSRAKMMDVALQMGELKYSRFDLLPKIGIEGGYEGRSDHATVSARDSVTLQPSLSNPYYSLDRDRNTADLSLSWNLLDFGVSWYNAKQNADRVLIAVERRRKAVSSLVQETRSAFWRAVAAQQLGDAVIQTIDQANKALRDTSRATAEQLQNPAESLRYQKVLLENLRMLEDVNQELSTAKAELAALINQPPGVDFQLEIPSESEMQALPWEMSADQMEEMAFVSNPDLREQTYQSRISIDETHKAILKLLPGITFGASRNYDSNSFLVDNMWNQASAKISFNLLNLISGPTQIAFADANEDAVAARRLALRMAVLAQVHVSRIQYASSQRAFNLSNDLARVEKQLAHTMAARQENDAQSVLDRVNAQTSYIASELRRNQAYARMQNALGKMQSTIGLDLLPEQGMAKDVSGLSAQLQTRLKQLDIGVIPQAPAPTAVPMKAPEKVVEKPVETPVVAAAVEPKTEPTTIFVNTPKAEENSKLPSAGK